MKKITLTTKPSKDYELLDSGEGMKLERFGSVIASRPDPQVLWGKSDPHKWKGAQVEYTKEWKGKDKIPTNWQIDLSGIIFRLKLSSFKHVGVFPEQEENWNWIEDVIKKNTYPVKVLNLFGYTGGATLFSLRAGAEVTHVDGSKTAISWARENSKLSGLDDKPVRWILDDAFAFVEREVRRGNKYDAIILDPPSFGRGPKGEVWKIEEHLPRLLSSLSKILSDKPLFVVLNGYAAGYSPIGYGNSLLPLMEKFGGDIYCGEVGIEESEGKRVLPAGIVARWYRG